MPRLGVHARAALPKTVGIARLDTPDRQYLCCDIRGCVHRLFQRLFGRGIGSTHGFSKIGLENEGQTQVTPTLKGRVLRRVFLTMKRQPLFERCNCSCPEG